MDSTAVKADRAPSSGSGSQNEKAAVSQLEQSETGILSYGYDAVATKKLVRKMDLVLIPFLALLYL